MRGKLLPGLCFSGVADLINWIRVRGWKWGHEGTFVVGWPSSGIVPRHAYGGAQGCVTLFIKIAQVFEFSGTGS